MILLGRGEVGKSSLIKTFILNNPFKMQSRTKFDYYNETFQIPDGSHVNVEILDTGGQEIYNALNRQYYRRADCCVLVYDITNEDSFKECKNYYHKEIINNCKKDIKVILVGNKTDLEDKRKVKKEDGVKLAEKYNYYFKETSCEKNYGVADVFETIILMTHNDMVKNGQFNYDKKENLDMEPTKSPTIRSESFSLSEGKTVKKDEKKKCC